MHSPPPSFFGPLVSGSCSGSHHFFGPQSSFPGSLGFRGCGFWVSPFFFARTSRLWSFSSFFREIYFPCLFVDWLWIFGGGVFLVRFTSSLPSSRKEVSSVNLSFQREVKPSLSLGFEVSVFQRFLPSGVPPPPSEIDLFASLLFSQLPKFYARFRDPLAWIVDAMSFCWSGLHLFSFPRSPCFPEFWRRFSQDGVEVALVAPFWPQRLCFPCLSWPVFLGLCLARRFFWGNPSLSCLSLGAKVYIFHSDRFQASWKGGRPFCQSS